MKDEAEAPCLPLPNQRCLTKAQAAAYLGIGVTLLAEIGPAPVKIRRRCVYDRVDLDAWLDDYKRRGRARTEVLWPVKEESTNDRIPGSGGLTWYSRMDAAYAAALGLKSGKRPRRSSPG